MIYPWQTTQWQQVQQQLTQGRLAHAFLLSGIQGLGKRDFAQALAQFLLCDSPAEYACGHCRHCRFFEGKTHPDFFMLMPEEKSSVIKIDQVRTLIDSLNQTPQLAKRQVAIVYPLEVMTSKAVNALLKTLEEPAGNVLFILVCDRLGAVPLTVFSRCQRLNFYVSDKSSAQQWLESHIETPADAATLLRLAHGAPLLAKTYAQNNYLALRQGLLKKMHDSVAGHNALSGIDQLLKHDIYYILAILRDILCDLRKLHLNVSPHHLCHCDSLASLQALVTVYSQEQLQTQLDALNYIEQVLRRGIHINPQLALESLFLSKELL